MFGPSREEVTGGWRERHSEERLCTVCRRLWGIEVEEGGMGRSCRIVGRLKRGVQFGDVGICVRMTLEVVSKKEMLRVECIELSLDSVELCAVLNVVMNLWVV